MTKKIMSVLMSLVIAVLLGGCYTQLATTDEEENYSYKNESRASSSQNYSWYDTYPSASYWGFQYYYPSWYSFWYYDRYYPYPLGWYDPWYGPALIVYPAPYWYYHYYYYPHYWYDYHWGWYGGSYGSRSTTPPRTWGSQRATEAGFRDFGTQRSENTSSGVSVSPAGRVAGSSSGASGATGSLRRTSEESTSSGRTSPGRNEAPVLRRSDNGSRSSEERGGVTRESQSSSSGSTSRQIERREESVFPSRNRTSDRQENSTPRESSNRSVERSSSQPSSHPSAPAPSRSSGNESRSSDNTARGRSTR